MVDVPAGDWITLAEAAALLGLTKRRVQVFVKAGRLPATRVGIQFLVRRADVLAFAPGKPGRPPKTTPAPDPSPPPKGKPRGRNG